MVDLDVIPSNSTFSIWGFIWSWQVILIIYFHVAIFRKTPNGYLYQHPAFDTAVYPLNIFSYLVTVGWVISFDRLELGWSLACLLSCPLVLFTSVALSAKRVTDNEEQMKNIGSTKDMWLLRLLVQNGISFYGTWVTIASLLNLGMLVVYRWGGDQVTGSMTVLGGLSAIFVAFFILDNFVFYKYIQYIVSPYVVVIVALRGVIVRSWDMKGNKELSMFVLCLLIAVCVFLLVKIIIMAIRLYKSRTQPKAVISTFEKV